MNVEAAIAAFHASDRAITRAVAEMTDAGVDRDQMLGVIGGQAAVAVVAATGGLVDDPATVRRVALELATVLCDRLAGQPPAGRA